MLKVKKNKKPKQQPAPIEMEESESEEASLSESEPEKEPSDESETPEEEPSSDSEPEQEPSDESDIEPEEQDASSDESEPENEPSDVSDLEPEEHSASSDDADDTNMANFKNGSKSDRTKPKPKEQDAELPISSEDDDEMDLANFKNGSRSTRVKPAKKAKRGIIYISNIPKHMNVTRLREILGEYGKIGRVYLQPEKLSSAKAKKNKRKRYNIHFTEGWVEFESKGIAKFLATVLNNSKISTRKKSQFYDSLWSMKYLPRFKWVHLTERMNYEQAVHKQRLHTEVSQARKETTFFQNNLDKSDYLKKQAKKAAKADKAETYEMPPKKKVKKAVSGSED
ncbi:activator of basal transcription 1 [Drosophila biarmipes]|uniref:activator of basal transcription 1 n=1 Tax=Drosophila biarmipes TaxID=125945 RepID=UPI0007E83DE2|nr:activator of basal transcription 1 [Drosophila biarmipes]